jgi:hypothetical protein
MVEAFISALERHGWQLPEASPAPADQGVITAQDHDDPTAPLQVIDSA